MRLPLATELGAAGGQLVAMGRQSLDLQGGPSGGQLAESGASSELAACHHAAMYLSPVDRPRTPCWHCRHMESVDPQTSIACCGLPDGPQALVTARDGCLRFEREPGIDDDDWNPKPLPFMPSPAPRQRNVSRDGWWTEPRRPRSPRQCRRSSRSWCRRATPSVGCSTGTTTVDFVRALAAQRRFAPRSIRVPVPRIVLSPLT